MLRSCYSIDLDKILIAGYVIDEVALHEKSPFARQPSY
jgi:hypothetical protein